MGIFCSLLEYPQIRTMTWTGYIWLCIVASLGILLVAFLGWRWKRRRRPRNLNPRTPPKEVSAGSLATRQKMEALGRLAGGLAHELNNSVSLIAGYAEELEQKGQEKDLGRKLQEAVVRIKSLTDQVLTFSGRHPSTHAPVDLYPIVEQSVKRAAGVLPPGVRFRWKLQEETFPVAMSPQQATTLILNLLLNARDAVTEKGWIQVRLEHTEVAVETLWSGGTLSPGKYCLLAVKDNGCGMSSDVKCRIYEPFFTTRGAPAGTGLGLSNVFGIVQAAGGAILVDSRPGKGCEFKVLLPCLTHSTSATSCLDPPWEERGGPIRVALVEDESSLRNLLERTLIRSGYQVESVGDGKDALEEFSGRAHEFDILVSDIVLPGLRGPELAQCLKLEHPSLRVLLMSGYIDSTPDNFEFESDLFLQKPFTPGQLLQAVRDLSGQEGREAPLRN